ncbi:cytochrome P450 [Ganoderma leucocontextum]|nr:cytochrome P450 [Ganoderma leucocontextum]
MQNGRRPQTKRKVALELVDVLRGEAQEKPIEVGISDYLGRYSLELTMVKLHLWRRFLPWLTKTFPPYLLRLGSDFSPWRALHEMKAISNTLYTASILVLAQRKYSLQQEGEDPHGAEGGKDLLSFLLKDNMMSGNIDCLSESDLLGQMSYVLNNDSAGTLLICLSSLMLLHRELVVDATTCAGRSLSEMDNDSFAGLKFLNAVVRETLRICASRSAGPSYIFTDKDIPLPLGSPVTGRDGRLIHEVVVAAGTTVLVNLSALPQSVTDAHVPSVFANILTFSSGPRTCIGYNIAGVCSVLTYVAHLGIAIARLVLAFDFNAPSDKEIEWKFTVRGSPAKKPELPIILTPIKFVP